MAAVTQSNRGAPSVLSEVTHQAEHAWCGGHGLVLRCPFCPGCCPASGPHSRQALRQRARKKRHGRLREVATVLTWYFHRCGLRCGRVLKQEDDQAGGRRTAPV